MKPLSLTAVAMVKNEATYLDEWIAYHYGEGVQHFIIYDNNSEDDTRLVLQRYISHGLVTLLSWPLNGSQIAAYNHAVWFFGSTTEWLLFLDLDEFILRRGHTLGQWLSTLPDDVSQVRFPWRNFQFSGHEKRPEGLVIESYEKAQNIPDGGFVHHLGKSVIRASAIRKVFQHHTEIKTGITVDPCMAITPSAPHFPVADFTCGQVFHYWTKSVEEFEKKIARGQGDGGSEKKFFRKAHLDTHTTTSQVPDSVIARTKQQMARFRRFSPEPGCYGSELSSCFKLHDELFFNFHRFIANASLQTPHVTVSFTELPILMSDFPKRVLDLPPTLGPVLGYIDSLYMKDFLRRNRSKIIGSDASQTHHTSGSHSYRFSFDLAVRRFVLVADITSKDDSTVGSVLIVSRFSGRTVTLSTPAFSARHTLIWFPLDTAYLDLEEITVDIDSDSPCIPFLIIQQ